MKTYSQIAALGMIALAGSLSASAQQTTLRLGIPGDRPDSPPLTYDLTTTQVDAVLRGFSPGRFGNTYTQDKVNGLIGKVSTLTGSLSASIADQIRTKGAGTIKNVNYVTINANPLNVRFKQTDAGVNGEVSGVSAGISISAWTSHHWVCPIVTISFAISNIRLAADYSLYDGSVQNPAINYSLNNVSSSCSGLLGFLGDFFTPDLTGSINNTLTSGLSSATSGTNLKTLFSATDLVNALLVYSSRSPSSQLSALALGAAQQIVVNPASVNLGLQLDIQLATGATNILSIYASHQAPVLDVYWDEGVQVTVTDPPNTLQSDAWSRRPNSSTWVPSRSGSVGTVPRGTAFVAISSNQTISGLRSFPSPVKTAWYPYCVKLMCEQ